MPKIDLTVPEGALSDEAKAKLPGRMAAALLRWEGAPDTEFFRSISWTHVHELPAGAIHDADGPTDSPRALIEVTTPAGALSERRRTGLVEEVTELIMEATGWEEEAKLRVWVIGHEVPDGLWGAAGQVVRFEQLRRAAKAERDGASGEGAVRETADAPA